MVLQKVSVRPPSLSRRLRPIILNATCVLFILGGSAVAFEDVPFEILGGDQCFMFSDLVPRRTENGNVVELPLELVIRGDASYRALFDPKIMRHSCAGVDLSKVIPNVDFSKKTVLGLWSSGSCAVTSFQKRVMKDDRQKTVIYSVSAVGAPRACLGPGLDSLNLIAIPKVPEGYKFVFENIPE